MLKAYSWLKIYWPAVALGLMVLAVIDATLSSLLSCHPISANPGGGAYSKPNQEECTAFNGPILVSLTWLLKGLHKYEGAFLAIFTVVLAVFTGRLWHSTEKMSVATKRLVEGAEDTANRQLRAYVSPIGAALFDFDANDPEKPFSAVVVFKNSGQTPAYEFSANGGIRINAFPLPNDETFPIREELPGRASIGPGNEYRLNFGIEDFKKEYWPAVKSRKYAIYVYGSYQYKDAFSQQRSGTFKLYYGGDAMLPDFGLSFYGEGNTTN